MVVAYGSGHVRLFNLTQINEPYLAVEICAHARWITAMDVAPERGYILTVSEDSFARVFQIHRTENTVST